MCTPPAPLPLIRPWFYRSFLQFYVKREVKTEKKKRLHNRCTEIVTKLIPDKSKSSQLCQLGMKEENIPVEKQTQCQELNLEELNKLKPKFHLEALKHLKLLNIFSGDALAPVHLAIHRLVGKPSVCHAAADKDDDDDHDHYSGSGGNENYQDDNLDDEQDDNDIYIIH